MDALVNPAAIFISGACGFSFMASCRADGANPGRCDAPCQALFEHFLSWGGGGEDFAGFGELLRPERGDGRAEG